MVGRAGGIPLDGSVTRSTPVLRLPVLEEFDDVFGPYSSGGFEFALFLAHDEFAVRIEDGQAGDPLFEGDFIFLRDVQVPIIIPYVYMNHVIVFVDERGDFLRMERSVQNMAVVAPIPTKDEENALMVFRGGGEGRGDLCRRLLRVLIKLYVRLGRFGQAPGCALLQVTPLSGNNPPVNALPQPYLSTGNSVGFLADGGLKLYFIPEDKKLGARLQILHFENFDVKTAEPRGPERRPERRLLGGIVRFAPRRLGPGRRRCRVEGCERRFVTQNNGRLPAIEWFERGRSRHFRRLARVGGLRRGIDHRRRQPA